MMKRLQFRSLSVALAAVGLIIFASPGSALGAADFNAGYIIDDAVFYNKDSMNVQQIQDFLNSKVPSCDSYGTKSYAGTTRGAYSQAHGQTLPLICLKDYYENPNTHANNLQGNPVPAGAESAAQIIWDAAHAYGVNPQVLIVILQKEQGLVTDDWPWQYQYDHAMGYACPDSAPCDTAYYGFYNQVTNAARQFRLYANSPNSYNYLPNQNNNILWNPNTACGSRSVFIRNQATASLYNYTPYQPNQAAISGSGDGCSSYGNLNFFTYFVNWFGSPYTVYSWTTVSQNAYYDSDKTRPVDLGKLGPGQRYYLTVVVKNTGNVTWQRDNSGVSNPVHLGTVGPQDRASPFCDGTWVNSSPGCNRAAYLHEWTVPPGGFGSFEFWITTPNTPGSYTEQYAPVQEGLAWMNASSMSFPMIVNPPTYSGIVTGQYAYTNSSKQSSVDIRHLVPGQRYYLGVTVKNTGDVAWQRTGTASNPVNLGTISTRDRSSPFCDNTWQSCNRAAVLHEYTVLPGQTGSFEFWITAPNFGNYTETYAPVMENTAWFDSTPISFNHSVEPYHWSAGQIQAYKDSTRATPVSLNNLDPGQRYFVSIPVQNTGWATWQRSGSNPVSLGTANSRDHSSTLCDTSWTGCNRAAMLHEWTVSSGQTGSFEFWITAPTTPGTHTESFTPLLEGLQWMGGDTIDLSFTINQPHYTWSIIEQNAFTDSSKTTRVNMGTLTAGQRYYLTVTIKNTGNTTWSRAGSNPFSLGTVSPRDRTSVFCDSTWPGCNRPALLHEWSVAPGQYGSFEFWITAPGNKATYNELYAPLLENLDWLDSHTVSFPAIVN